MLRMNQKIRWTRTELQKFAEYDGLECEAMLMADEAMNLIAGAEAILAKHEKEG